MMKRPEKTVVPTIDAITKNGPLLGSETVFGSRGSKPLRMSVGGGIIMKKLIKKLSPIIATITARLRSKISVFPFQNIKNTKIEKKAAK